jgi:DNA invertase Pin-like site-specific DNA recombinase
LGWQHSMMLSRALLRRRAAEVETGKGADVLNRRPKLAAAIRAARKNKAAVIVSKLDRLSRDVHFISSSLGS